MQASEKAPVLERVKFNVIIPTRERSDTLYHALRTVVAQDYSNLSIIVSDNFSGDDTKAVVDSFDDPRIRYINTGRRVSMSHNWEFALSHVTEGWITFLGDDDGMLPGCLARIADVIKATRASAVMSQWRFYSWPNCIGNANQLTIPLGQGYEQRSSRRWLAKLMRGEVDYHELPYLYTGGFADFKLIDSARNGDGAFFCSMTPDVFSAIVIASRTDSYVMLQEPVCVMGVSSHSNGASNLSSNSPTQPSDLFFSEKNIPFHPILGSPRIKSIQIIVYEAYLQSLHIHSDALQIELAEQMALALAAADPGYYPQLKSYCDEVMDKSAGSAAKFPLPLRRWSMRVVARWRTTLKRIRQGLADLSVDAAAYHVKDVFGAAQLTSTLYRFHRADRHWRVRKVIAFLVRRLRS